MERTRCRKVRGNASAAELLIFGVYCQKCGLSFRVGFYIIDRLDESPIRVSRALGKAHCPDKLADTRLSVLISTFGL
jgi:hypothetical protein